MRKLLLRLANKIYGKYGFKQIKEGQALIFKDGIFRIVSINLIQEVDCVDELIITLHKQNNLADYITEKIILGDKI